LLKGRNKRRVDDNRKNIKNNNHGLERGKIFGCIFEKRNKLIINKSKSPKILSKIKLA